jgi:fructose transport system ATP-binding protein
VDPAGGIVIDEMATPSPLQPTDVPALSARGIIKRFGRVTALAGADFDLYPGEVLGVIGDNGAGKSTLIKVLCGAYKADEGEIWMDGAPITFHDPLDARSKGIETVYQNLAVAPGLDIAANLSSGASAVAPASPDRCSGCSTARAWTATRATR